MIKQQAQTQPEGFYSAREIPAEYTLNYYVKASEDRVRKVQRGICLDKVVDDNCKQYSQTEMARRQYPTLFDDVSSPTLSVREYQTMRSFNPTTEHQKHDQLRTFFKEKYRAINHFIDGDEIDAYKERKQKRQAKQVAMRAKREATRKPKDLLTRLNDLIISEVTNEVDQQKQEEQDAKRLALEKELMSKKLVVFSSPRRKKIQLAPAVKHKQYWKTPNLKKSVRLWKVDLNTQNPGLIQQYPKPPNSAEDRQLGLLFGSTKQATQSTKKLSSTASARHVLMSRPQTQQSICDNQKMSRAMTVLVTDGVKRKRQFFNAFQPSLDIQNVLLSEFTSKLNRTRNVLQDINRQCSFMKKDLKKLEGELAVANAEKDKALQTEENLKIHFISTKVLYDEEHEKQVNEHERLVKLRRLKKQKLREKDLMKKELDRANQELNQLLRERGELEHTAQNLSEKLDKASMERLNAETECREHGKVLDNLDAELDELRNERNSLNQVVTATIEEEVKAASSKQF